MCNYMEQIILLQLIDLQGSLQIYLFPSLYPSIPFLSNKQNYCTTVANTVHYKKLKTFFCRICQNYTYQNCPVICMPAFEELFCSILRDGDNIRCFSVERKKRSFLFLFPQNKAYLISWT